MPIEPDSLDGPFRGRYEEDDEVDEDEEETPTIVTAEVGVLEGKKGSAKPSSASRAENQDDEPIEEQDATVFPTSRVWLYASIFLVALCAVLYVVRRKLKP